MKCNVTSVLNKATNVHFLPLGFYGAFLPCGAAELYHSALSLHLLKGKLEENTMKVLKA